MEVDPPTSSNISTPIHGHGAVSNFHSRDLESETNGVPAPGILKRSNSAPMMNILVSTQSIEISPPSTYQTADAAQRTRRFSSSSMNVHASTTPVKVDRLNQIKQEESHIADRDIQREREVRSAIKISTSWTEFSLGDHEPMIAENTPRRPRSFSESLHIFTSPSQHVGAPSPTRVGKQCFSPSMQAPIKNNTFTPSPSPSPTRKTIGRSLSPIIMRPSPLGKRKLESDGDCRYESYMSPPKRFHTGPSTPDRLIPHPLAHSNISSSSFEGSSPEQTVPRNASIPTIPISSRPQPHMFGFMPLRDSQDMQTTDSETSDMTESTDMSEAGDSSSGLLLTATDSPSLLGFTQVKQNPL